MAWNKVMAKTKYKSGTFPVQAYADDSVCVGDKARILVLAGYECDCEIIDIVKRNVRFGKDSGQILEVKHHTILKEENIMFGAKTVEVKHVSSARTGIYYTDLDLQVGQTVVYESDNGMHVGVVTNIDPDAISAQTWIVDLVDMTEHEARIERTKQAKKLKAKLDAKRKQFQDIELLRLIAANDPETAAILSEYTKLIGGKS
jgi:hypothetical protein